MEAITLNEFVSRIGQKKAADLFGIRQSAISKALNLGRNIKVYVSPDGIVQAEEIKKFPSIKNKNV